MEKSLLKNAPDLMRRLVDGTFELRILQKDKFNSVWSCIRDDFDKDWATTRRKLVELNKKANVFFTLNPLKPACRSKMACGAEFVQVRSGEGVSDSEIEKYRWLLIDLDPDRPKDISSSDEEKALAYQKAQEIKAFLVEKGFFEPVFCDSGNGYHLLFRIDIENSKESSNLLRDFLNTLSEKFSDSQVKVDRKVFNAARIVKYYGSTARKGKDDEANGRPHRVSGFVCFPDDAESKVNPKELIESLVEQKPKKEKGNFSGSQTESIDAVREFLDEYDIAYREEDKQDGFYFYLEDGCVFNPDHKGKDACVIVNQDGMRIYKCFHDSCEGNHWKDFVKLFDPEYKTFEERKAEDANILQDMFGGEESELELPMERPQAEYRLVEVQRNEKGKVLPTIENYLNILREDRELKDLFGFNELSQMTQNKRTGKDWRDSDDAKIMLYIEKMYGINKKEAFTQAKSIREEQMAFNPVKDILDALVWDGQPRLETSFINYLGAEDSEYTRFLAKMIFVAAVKRAYEPGCKFDNMVVLVGPQGCGKSTFCERMALKEEFFTDSIRGVGSKEAIEQLLGSWVVEWGEMSAMRRAKDAETLKLFLAQKVDKFRNAYGKYTLRVPRRCIFIGTSNDTEGLLTDRTGNRRFFPIEVSSGRKSLVSKTVRAEFEQIYAEAKELYKKGFKLYVPEKLYTVVSQKQEDFLVEDPRESTIVKWIETQEGLKKVCTKMVWREALGLRVEDMKQKDSIELGKIFNRIPFLKKMKHKTAFDEYGYLNTWENEKDDFMV